MPKAALDARYLLCKRAKKVEGKRRVAKITYLFQPTKTGIIAQRLFEAEPPKVQVLLGRLKKM
ncbi:unnamed protein product [Prorocentrum cordatum]|uniref:Uncharacterized protein n=1 Tax=Prorocentrum cordatum TaxID=2364126 RepID=A0ABN9P8L6_9DINO|nr:unnamed protein product [Polarella glacialis]